MNAAGGKLYACGNGALDDFLVGVSSDEGKTWSPVARLDQVMGAMACVRARCLTTETWLCDSYGRCPPGIVPTGPVDGAASTGGADAAAACTGDRCKNPGGCSCDVGDRSQPGGFALVLLFSLGARAIFARVFRAFLPDDADRLDTRPG